MARYSKREFKKKLNKIYCLDAIEGMRKIPGKSIDMILVDPPYGTTACSWDSIIPFERMWKQFKRITKDNAAIVLTASEPFASLLRTSNIKMYKYDWVWNKKLAGNGILAKIQPLKIHEIICVFSKNKCIYYPQMRKGKLRTKLTNSLKVSEINSGDGNKRCKQTFNDDYYPVSIQEFSLAGLRKGRSHPTQKPVKLFQYLIKTYTNEGDVVLDCCVGSGTTAIAAKILRRNFICFDSNKEYVEIARNRLKDIPSINERLV